MIHSRGSVCEYCTLMKLACSTVPDGDGPLQAVAVPAALERPRVLFSVSNSPRAEVHPLSERFAPRPEAQQSSIEHDM